MSFQNMFRALNISGSGLSAERTRMNVIAQNIANANTLKTAEGGPYKKKEVIFSAVLDAARGRGGSRSQADSLGGVEVAGVVDAAQSTKRVYDPSSSMADKDGFVTLPNVDVVREMVDMISASRAYEANLAVGKTAKDMISATLGLGR